MFHHQTEQDSNTMIVKEKQTKRSEINIRFSICLSKQVLFLVINPDRHVWVQTTLWHQEVKKGTRQRGTSVSNLRHSQDVLALLSPKLLSWRIRRFQFQQCI